MNTAKALMIGFLAATATIIVAARIPKTMALEFLFAILVAITFVYFGFVLIDGRIREMFFEFGNIALTLTFAFLGLWATPFWLAAGYFIHGVWDAGRVAPDALGGIAEGFVRQAIEGFGLQLPA